MLILNLIFNCFRVLVSILSGLIHLLIRIRDVSFPNAPVDHRHDYVIVGGGSAGAILASRLSENPDVSVLLIEAGGFGWDILNIPLFGPLKQLSNSDWQYVTVPQKHSCFGLENNVSRWPAGKNLGGSTQMNYMIYLKGHPKDYISWRDPKSDHWSYDDIKSYYDKIENSCSQDNCQGGKTMNIRSPLYTTELSDAILESVKELGYTVHDINQENSAGFMKPQLNLNDVGTRWTSDQYLHSIRRNRPNLKILTNSVAEKILLLNGFEAYGVKIRRNGQSETVYANLEIILSAGTVGSAKLLMLSGIGPKSSEHEANISVVVDLPVGKNLQDHVTTGLDLGLLKRPIFSYGHVMSPASLYSYFARGRGPLTSGLVEAVGVIHSSQVDPARSSPDLEFMVMAAGVSSDKGVFLRRGMGISEKVWKKYFQPLCNESVVSIIPVLLHPKSVGEIKLNPRDPTGMPDIDPRYLSDESDVTTLVEGLRIVRRMTDTESLKRFGLRFNGRPLPGCEDRKFDSDEYWRCYVRHLTLTVYHPVGTCKMAPLEENGVVDHRLRVHKTNKLRVVDASVMPTLPSANTNAAVVMIAEKGADLIKEDYTGRLSSCQLVDAFVTSAVCKRPEIAIGLRYSNPVLEHI